jgi:hypothetical protein
MRMIRSIEKRSIQNIEIVTVGIFLFSFSFMKSMARKCSTRFNTTATLSIGIDNKYERDECHSLSLSDVLVDREEAMRILSVAIERSNRPYVFVLSS